MFEKFQEKINRIVEMMNSTGGGAFGPVAATDAANSLDGGTFKNTPIRDDMAVTSSQLKKKTMPISKRRKKGRDLIRRLDSFDPKKAF
jgi:hypothetical protein